MPETPADNIFSRILRGELPSHEVYADAWTYAFLDIYPQSPGHTLVIPRNYSANVFEAGEDDIAACLATVRRLGPAIQAACGAPGVTVITNTGRDAGQMIEYLHFHIIPRFHGDDISLYRLGTQEPPEVLEQMAARIRAHISGGD